MQTPIQKLEIHVAKNPTWKLSSRAEDFCFFSLVSVICKKKNVNLRMKL